MKKKYIVLCIVLIVVILLVLGISAFLVSFSKDKEATQEKMKEVLSNYEKFDKATDEFSDVRNDFYKYKDDLYLETLGENAEGWNKLMAKYEEAIKKVDVLSKSLKEDCNNYYGDVNVNGKCITFKANYEAANNYYITDVLIYNKLVDEYDKWNDGSYPKVNKAKFVVYKDYIDFDEDGEYFGKSEVSENE